MAVAEGNFGRLGTGQQQVYTTGNARIQLDPNVWETPGGMPEIAPSPDSPANIDRAFTDRSMTLQAWGTYGVLWPVVHQQLGVDPDLGHGKLSIVPQIPGGQQKVAGSNIRFGRGAVDVSRKPCKQGDPDRCDDPRGRCGRHDRSRPADRGEGRGSVGERAQYAVQAGHDDAWNRGPRGCARRAFQSADRASLIHPERPADRNSCPPAAPRPGQKQGPSEYESEGPSIAEGR